MKKVLLIVIVMLVAPLCLQANVPLAVHINGPKKLATGSSKVPYTCDVQGNLNGTILSYCWSCTGEDGEDYSDLFDGGTNTYKIFITDAPTNFWLDVYMYYRSNTDSNEYILATEERIQVMEPVFNIQREAGLNGGSPNSSTLIHMFFNIDDDDYSAGFDEYDCGSDYLQTSYFEGDTEDDMLYFKISTAEPGLDVSYGKLYVVVGEGLKVWKDQHKGSSSLLFDYGTTSLDGSINQDNIIISHVMSKKCYVEGVDICNTSILIKYNNKEIYLLPYQTHACTAGRQPNLIEREDLKDAFPLLKDCDWSIFRNADIYYNCIAYALQPSIYSSSRKYWVYDTFHSNIAWQLNAHNYLTNSYEYRFYNHCGVNYTSMDLWNNQNMKFSNGDKTQFYRAHYYEDTLSYSDAIILFYNGFHAARKATSSQKINIYNNSDMAVSKCGTLHVLIHHSDQLANTNGYQNIINMYKSIPQPEPEM
jgi:hypothetical protein